MTILEDDVDVEIQNREVTTDKRWCCMVPSRDGLRFRKSIEPLLYKWQELDRRHRTKARTVAGSSQCVLVVLPAGVEPNDLKVKKWVKT